MTIFIEPTLIFALSIAVTSFCMADCVTYLILHPKYESGPLCNLERFGRIVCIALHALGFSLVAFACLNEHVYPYISEKLILSDPVRVIAKTGISLDIKPFLATLLIGAVITATGAFMGIIKGYYDFYRHRGELELEEPLEEFEPREQ